MSIGQRGWTLNRREFLTLALSGLASLAWEWLPWPDKQDYSALRPVGLGRVTIKRISIRPEPSFRAPIQGYLYRDMVVRLLEIVNSPYGPAHNPKWYRVVGGYIHSSHVQRVKVHLQTPWQDAFPESGLLGEISVPYTRALRRTRRKWEKVYRLYYQSVYWVQGVDEGPDGRPWYRLWDELLRVNYWVPATHMRLIFPEELTPISSHVPPEAKRIEVDLRAQRLWAFEDDRIVLETSISSGLPSHQIPENGIPTETPTGRFHIYLKLPTRHMGDGDLVSSLDAYELPGVPWVSFFHRTGVAFHGTYWHDNFGMPMSRGCINMRVEEARWLYRWSLPEVPYGNVYKSGFGTRVVVTK